MALSQPEIPAGLTTAPPCLVLMSGRMVKETGVKPIARIAGITRAALDPTIMGYGPVIAAGKLFEKLGNDGGADGFDRAE